MDSNKPVDSSSLPQKKHAWEIIKLLGFMAAYFALQLWLLPSIGVET